MDINGARHDDLSGCIVGRIRLLIWFLDDEPIANPDITLAVPLIGGINDVSTSNARQHERSLGSLIVAVIRVITSETEITSVRFAAANVARVPVAAKYWTAGLSIPGRPTVICTRVGLVNRLPGAVSAIVGSAGRQGGGSFL